MTRSFIRFRVLFAIVLLSSTPSLHAQQVQPPVPVDTVFPLGGLVNGLNTNIDPTTELPRFGLNMLYNGSNGVPGIVGLPTDLNYFIPSGTYGVGWNPLFAQGDFDLTSNETGTSAWDLFSNWGLVVGALTTHDEWKMPSDVDLTAKTHPGYYLWGFNSASTYSSTAVYQQGQWVTVSGSSSVWVCKQENTTGQTPSSTNTNFWSEITPYNPSSNYSSTDYVTASDPSSPFTVWKSTQDNNQNNTPGFASSFWVPAFPLSFSTFLAGDQNGNTTGAFYVDYVARIDPNDYSSISDHSTEIYALELSVLWPNHTSDITYQTSTDDGRTWSSPTLATNTVPTPVEVPLTINDLLYSGSGGTFSAPSVENHNILNFPNL